MRKSNQQRTLYRQGDVLFVSVKALPRGTRTKRPSGVVAEGEMTGHSHRLAIEDMETSAVLEIGDNLFLRVGENGIAIDGSPGATIVHEEHGPITLPPGNYEVRKQRERDLFSEAVRPVLD